MYEQYFVGDNGEVKGVESNEFEFKISIIEYWGDWKGSNFFPRGLFGKKKKKKMAIQKKKRNQKP